MEDKKKGIFIERVIAENLGINGAIILGRIQWKVQKHKEEKDLRYFKEDKWWMCESIPSLAKYSILGVGVVTRTIKKLREMEILTSSQLKKQGGDMSSFYTVNNEILSRVLCGGEINKAKHAVEMDVCPPQNDTMPYYQNDSMPLVKMDVPPLSKRQDAPYQNDSMPPVKINVCPLSKRQDAPPQNECLSSSTKDRVNTRVNTREKDRVTRENTKPSECVLDSDKPAKYTLEDLDIAKSWLEYAKSEMTWRFPPTSWTEDKFAEGIAKIRKTTNLNFDGVRSLLDYVSKDPFWCKNAWSPVGLLKKSSNDVRKIDNILKNMKTQSEREADKMDSWGQTTAEDLKPENIFR